MAGRCIAGITASGQRMGLKLAIHRVAVPAGRMAERQLTVERAFRRVWLNTIHSSRGHTMAAAFDGFDISKFWEQSQFADQDYVDEPLTDELVESVEHALGYTLPRAYVQLMKYQNGGIPRKTNHRTKQPTSWADDHVAITGIYAIGRKKSCSLCGEHGSQFWIEEWGYPPIGVYFADCPSAGHDMMCLDYRECGPTGEPQVVYVDQECDYKITFVAKSFESFIRGLEDDEAFEV